MFKPGILSVGVLRRKRGRSVGLNGALQDKLLFWGKYSEITGGQMPNKVTGATDYLSVSGSVGSETYQCPNTAPYIAADTDYIWFKTNGVQRATTTAELIGYDLQHTPVKYLDNSPNSIEDIVILKEALTSEELKTLHSDFRLPIMWRGNWCDEGVAKSNRPDTEQILWTPEGVIGPAVLSAQIAQADKTKVIITFDQALLESSIPDTTCFALAGKTITNVAVSGSTVTLTVSAAYAYGDSGITVDYTKPISNAIKALDDSVAADSFTGQVVTNNIYVPTAFDDGNTVGWYDFLDLTTITKDGSNLISKVTDKMLLGSAHDLNAYGSSPTYNSAGTIFNGGTNEMQTGAFTFAQPEFIYIVMKQITWVIGRSVFDGYTNGTGKLNQRTSTPNLNLFIYDQGTVNPDLAVDTWGIVRVKFHGANTFLQVNEGTPVGGIPSYNNPAMGGFTIGGTGNHLNHTNIQVKEIILRNSADDSTKQTDIYNYLKTKYGL